MRSYDSGSEEAPPIPSVISGPSQELLDAHNDHQPRPQQPPDHCTDSAYNDGECNSGEVDRAYTGVFEGPEKTLEVCFRRCSATPTEDVYCGSGPQPSSKVGLRDLCRRDLDIIGGRCRCTILSKISNLYLDAYVLSESSLFVYPYMIVIKTCGTTTLLRCVAVLIKLGKKIGLEIDWVGYSRKNFSFPGEQAFPHTSFLEEMEYLSSHRKLSERLQGNGYTLGPVTSDHWFVFVADQTIRASYDTDTDRVLNIMMFDIDVTVAETFYYDQYEPRKENETEEEASSRISIAMTKKAGIDALVPGAIIDPRAFEPCGYSMNAILFRSYSTMHITPEDGSSYASFETNQKVVSYASIINNVVRTFKPRRFVMTLMADVGGLTQMKENPLTDSGAKSRITVPCANNFSMHYKRHDSASIKVEDDTCCMMGNWVLDDADYAKITRGQRERGFTIS
mmetsp:Transcript_28627/g.42359  ORF Transcript_28627/g.42359 Transcript_28627/m.42359 type:complete len:451 (-) Transcript_28627:270-1622(-)|eukprot:CAMPEP_0195507274 /NCGR_PEP_ID=MMETSP0794_2-20130614/754_1 /TAXON_ID=515487 /ORGANISM="Stephanopyxis turris, Strain CCMP 815" /LENGTH=450 /DNA_ID=CAMNT_0040633907 /DNA_START=233 /DNA_END=1585 /DNA_ORIENTATION=-